MVNDVQKHFQKSLLPPHLSPKAVFQVTGDGTRARADMSALRKYASTVCSRISKSTTAGLFLTHPFLLKMFDCHINVECCQTIASVKYLFKYYFKGGDMVTVEGINGADEVQKYVITLYISACQAYWRIAEFNLVQMKPSVSMLTVHLEKE